MRRKREMDGAAFRNGIRRHQGEEDDYLYGELWRECAGSSVFVPRIGEQVYYFPQGHLEQVAAFTQHQQDGHMEVPVYNLPSKILCRVVSVALKAEVYTDEVFAQITLLPVNQKDDPNLENNNNYEIPSRKAMYSFSKTLTPSDTSTHGGFSIPKRHADEGFLPLDMTQQTPTMEMVAKDLHGFEWNFRHIYRGQPKRHLLTCGWSTFVNSKKIVAGDTCIFVSGENGEVRVGIRRAVKPHMNASTSSSLISGHSMKLGILTSATHAISSGSMFIVYYHPWTNPFEFIIPLQNYLKSTVADYSIGTRVQMVHEGEDSAKRHVGTIVGTEDVDHIRWPGSEWRSLKVQWDDAKLDTCMYPERVCPWWIEPLKSAEEHIPAVPIPKKACAPKLHPLPGLSGFAMNDIVQNSGKPASERVDRDLQGQDYNGLRPPQPLQIPPSTDALFPLKGSVCGSHFGKEKPNPLPFLTQDPLHHYLGSSTSLAHENLSTSSSNLISSGSESQGWPSESKDENDVPFGQLGRNTYKLFGVSITKCQPELPSPQFAAFSQTSSPPMCITSEKTCKRCRSINSRSCTKVLKLGTALGRAVDVRRFSGYAKLLSELDSMFDFGGSLINGRSGWHVTCVDEDGDTMLFGDYPWQDFQSMVQKMIICPKDGINILNPRSSADHRSF